MPPVWRDSGGHFDAGWFGFTAGLVLRALPPGHYEPGAPSALSDAVRHRLTSRVEADRKAGPREEDPVRTATQNRLGAHKAAEPRDAGEPAS